MSLLSIIKSLVWTGVTNIHNLGKGGSERVSHVTCWACVK